MTTDSVIAETPPNDGREWHCQCARCGSPMDYTHCDQCDDGYAGHDCGEDCCACLEPEDNIRCDTCNGHGGWRACMSSEEWCRAHPSPGREHIERSAVEWFTLEEGAP